MTKKELATLKKGYQEKCIRCKHLKAAFDPKAEIIAEAENERIGYLHAAMALMDIGKQQCSSRPIIDEWEKEVNFDSRA